MLLRAPLCTFLPEQATVSELWVAMEPDGGLGTHNAALQDLSNPADVMQCLATSSDTAKLQLCHVRLLEMSTASHADKQCKAVIALKQWQNQIDKDLHKLKRAKSSGELDKCAARAARNKALKNKECFSLGFLEMCIGSATFLKQVVKTTLKQPDDRATAFVGMARTHCALALAAPAVIAVALLLCSVSASFVSSTLPKLASNGTNLGHLRRCLAPVRRHCYM